MGTGNGLFSITLYHVFYENAIAYIGNKNGLDVLDFRGGNSQYVFSMNSNIKKILEL